MEFSPYYLYDLVLYRCLGMNQLTPQEQQIVALIAQGLTNKEIVQRLGSSPFTVRNQVKVIMRKLGLKNRIQVAYLFGQRGRES